MMAVGRLWRAIRNRLRFKFPWPTRIRSLPVVVTPEVLSESNFVPHKVTHSFVVFSHQVVDSTFLFINMDWMPAV
jgi:hypothetical protein